ncbi:MerR family transcriptional regulator [Pandoraea apista]|mgnify:CR=1 FL=1|uniref:MerR family transcriptional regulator n=1 Tax=Pandoraea apista TaxID=93218 RepID=A0A0B5F6V3_9BURK|nr:MerR family transcriptional regulator [Pandoraea apista]AJE99959.1 MerR family transcriptional regulator [Pandoraea apista]AKH74104.1 MerR family transcriptional regulator [Pandoraea apista]AKI62652.1 MerR family transcriptional regulator [Pandoraea apista]ALS64360.1 MerR family transcriptional regulator [Pandoraea apista]AVF40940.1 MerR family DNA-binding transcriptional regulator [Pandoraea apista]
MKIGELAQVSGVAASRIRFYEAQGLLPNALRQANGYREYDDDALTRLDLIRRAQNAGFSLDEIRSILPPDLNAWPHDTLLAVLRRKVEEIDTLAQNLALAKRNLSTLIDAIEQRAEGESCQVAAQRVLASVRQSDDTPQTVPRRVAGRKRA